MEVASTNQLLPGDPRLVDHIVGELKSQGIFDQFRKECIADVDTKPAYQNLRQRVEGNVSNFLSMQRWKSDMNKNQLREMLRKNIQETGFLETGVERIVDQVVNPKINSIFFPLVEDVVYKFLGMEKPTKSTDKRQNSATNSVSVNSSVVDLLPTDLDPVSPASDKGHSKPTDDILVELEKNIKFEEDSNQSVENEINTNVNSGCVVDDSFNKTSPIDFKPDVDDEANDSEEMDDNLKDDEESPPFEPIGEVSFTMDDDNSNDSVVSGISSRSYHKDVEKVIKNHDGFVNTDYSNSIDKDEEMKTAEIKTEIKEENVNKKMNADYDYKMEVEDEIDNISSTKTECKDEQCKEFLETNDDNSQSSDVFTNEKNKYDNKEISPEKMNGDNKDSNSLSIQDNEKKDRHRKESENRKSRDDKKDKKSEHHTSSSKNRESDRSRDKSKDSKSDHRSRRDSDKSGSKYKNEKEKSNKDKKDYKIDEEKGDKYKERDDRSRNKDSRNSEKRSGHNTNDEKNKSSKRDNSNSSRHDSRKTSLSTKHSEENRDKVVKSKLKSDSDLSKHENKTSSSKKRSKDHLTDSKHYKEMSKDELDKKKDEKKKEEINKNKDEKAKEKDRSKDRDRSKKEHSSRRHSSSSYQNKSSSDKKESESKKDKHKQKYSKDDHFSSRGKYDNSRRSTDRDSNDGSAGGNYSQSSSSTHTNTTTKNITESVNNQQSNDSGSSGNEQSVSEDISFEQNNDTNIGETNIQEEIKQMNVDENPNEDIKSNNKSIEGNKERSVDESLGIHDGQFSTQILDGQIQVKIKKPKFASNIFEARRLMKIRKRLEKIEKKRQRQLNQVQQLEQYTPSPDAVSLDSIHNGLSSSDEKEDINSELSECSMLLDSNVMDNRLLQGNLPKSIEHDNSDSSTLNESTESEIIHKDMKAIKCTEGIKSDDNGTQESKNKKSRIGNDSIVYSDDDEDCLYLSPQTNSINERFLKHVSMLQNSIIDMKSETDSDISDISSVAEKRRSRKPNLKYCSDEFTSEPLDSDLDTDNNTKKNQKKNKLAKGFKRKIDNLEESEEIFTNLNNNVKCHENTLKMDEKSKSSFTSTAGVADIDIKPMKKPKTRNLKQNISSVSADSKFVMPLSPESDASISSIDAKSNITVNKTTIAAKVTIKNNSSSSPKAPKLDKANKTARSVAAQRYSSDDLYKPRPVIGSTRRSRGTQNHP